MLSSAASVARNLRSAKLQLKVHLCQDLYLMRQRAHQGSCWEYTEPLGFGETRCESAPPILFFTNSHSYPDLSAELALLPSRLSMNAQELNPVVDFLPP